MKTLFWVLFFVIFVNVNAAMAYVGPGAGLSAIGSILAFLGSIALLIVGFVWYPIKRIVSGIGKKTVKNKDVPYCQMCDDDGSELN